MKRMKLFGLAAAISLTAALTACSSGETSNKEVVVMEPTVLRTEFDAVDLGGAEIEVLSLKKPIEFSYSTSGRDMLFSIEDGVWYDYFTKEIPMDQDYMQQMADTFFNLKAIELVEGADPAACGFTEPQYSVYIFDQERGEKNIYFGAEDEKGNIYMRVNEGEIYTVSAAVPKSLNFNYETLLVRDSLNLNITPEQIQTASVKIAGNTKKYKPSDTEAMANIAVGLNSIKPVVFYEFLADEQDLANTDLTEKLRTTFYAEIDNGETVESLTIYIGSFADLEGILQYIQIEGSDMIAIVETAFVNQLINMVQE